MFELTQAKPIIYRWLKPRFRNEELIMKILNAALVITLMLVSSAALAERGSAKDNRVAYVDLSSMQQGHETPKFSPYELSDRNP